MILFTPSKLVNSSTIWSTIMTSKSRKLSYRHIFQLKKRKETYPTSNDNTSNDRNESDISEPSFSFEGHKIRKNGSKKWRRSTDSLIKRNRKITKRDVSANNRSTKNGGKCSNLRKLNTRSNRLHWNNLQPCNGDVT